MSYLPQAGDIFLKKYEVLNLIGEGAFGRVYKVKDLKLERNAALKIIDATHGSMERFINEVDGIKKLEHPNIVKLYDFDVLPDGSPCLVMEFVNGRELGDILSTEGTFTLQRIARISMQVLDALVETHSFNIVHCDLKPENIILSNVGARSDFVKLLDFGVASILSSSKPDEERPLMGTPQYMAPEQIRRSKIGPWTDIYALGLIMIELATGHFTVDAPEVKDILRVQLHQPIHLPVALAKTELGLIISRAVHKEPSERYQSARQMFHDIEEALANTGTLPEWGKLNDSRTASRIPHILPSVFSAHEDVFDSSSHSDLFCVVPNDQKLSSYDSPPLLQSAPESESVLNRPASFNSILDNALNLPEDFGRNLPSLAPVSQTAQAAISEIVPANKGFESKDEQGLVLTGFAERLEQTKAIPKREAFKIEGLSPATQAKIEQRQHERALLNRKSFRALLIFIFVVIAISFAAWAYLTRIYLPRNEEPSQTATGEEKRSSEEISIVNLRELSLRYQYSANTAAVEGALVKARSISHYKIIATPLESEVYINGRKLCSQTPCNIAVFGNVDDVEAKLKHGKETAAFKLEQVRNGADSHTLFPVLELSNTTL